MNDKTDDLTNDNESVVAQASTPDQLLDGILQKGNRELITDFFVPDNVSDQPDKFRFKVFVRLNSKKKITFKNVSFIHCIFDNCYFNNCVFDTCDFTGCRFLGSNFHQTTFRGCKFDFATFERSQLDDDILSEAPREENLRMRFARSLRMNYQQIGDAKAVNKAISLELEATSIYLYKSWRSGERYYKEKYPGLLNGIVQFVKWAEFWILDFVWGNGESILKLLRSIIFTIILIAAYDTNMNGSPLNIGFYWSSLHIAPALFLGIPLESSHNFTVGVLSFITGIRFVSIALLTALLVKRFSRR